MKFRRIHLERFGHFADAEIELSSTAPHFALIYGPNEAGKSTLLEALHSMLFGFERSTPYNFLFSYRELAVGGELEWADGSSGTVRRTKGNKGTLTGNAPGTAVNESWLDTRMGSPSEQLYRSVFGFSLADLEAGGDRLKEAGIDDALYGAGLGGAVSVTELRDTLDKRAGELYSPAPNASKPLVNAALGRVKEKRSQRNEAALRPKAYKELVTERDGIASELAGVSARRDEAGERRGLILRVAKALPLRADMAALREKLGEFSIPESLPEDAHERLKELERDRDRLKARIPQLETRVVQARQEAEAVPAARVLAPRAGEIKRLFQRVEIVINAREDLPKRESELSTLEGNAVSELRELRPGWSLDRLDELKTDRATRHQLTEAIRVLDDLDQRIESNCEEERERARALDRDRAELAAMGPPRDTAELEALQAGWSGHQGRVEELGKLEVQIAESETTLGNMRQHLDPPCPSSVEHPENLPVPTIERVEEFVDRYASHDESYRAATADLERASQDRTQAQAALEAKELRDVPGDDDLAAARLARDDRWRAIRGVWLDSEPPSDPPETMADGFESSVVRTDDLADTMRQGADLVATRQAHERELEAASEAEKQATSRVDELGRERGDLDRRWAALWESCGFAPLAPRHMLTWLRRHEELRKARESRDRMEPGREQLRGRIQEFTEQLRSHFPDDDRPDRALIREVEAELDQARQQTADRKALMARIDDAKETLARLKEETPNLKAQRETAGGDFQRAASAAGLEPDVQPSIADELLRDLAALRARLEEGPKLRGRIEQMEETIRAFETDAQRLVADLAPDLKSLPPEAAAERLSTRLTDEEASRRQHEERTKALTSAEEDLTEGHDQLSQAQTQINGLIDAAQADDLAGLRAVLEDRVRYKELEERLASQELSYEKIRQDGPVEAFDEAITDASSEQVEEERAELTAEIDRLGTRRDELNRELGQAERALQEVDGTSLAAELDSELEAELASLRDLAQEWAVYRIAHQVLSTEISEFGARNQPEVLTLASDLLRAMTAGRYTGIEVEFGKQTFRARRAEGAPLEPDALSTGTRQQLHLALRLGYVDHYCRTREPLPVVMDDVLVNFDDGRAEATLRALAQFSAHHQVLFLTCHEHLVEIARNVFDDLDLHRLPAPVMLS